jgi:hypothetical protein
MHEFHSTIDHEPCIIRVLSYEPYRPARIHGLPEDCYEDEGGYGDWEVCDLDGKPSSELAARLTDHESRRIDREIFDVMEAMIRERRGR